MADVTPVNPPETPTPKNVGTFNVTLSVPYPRFVLPVIGICLLLLGGYYGWHYWHTHTNPDISEPELVQSQTKYDIGDSVIVTFKNNAKRYHNYTLTWKVYDGEVEKKDFLVSGNGIYFGTGKKTPRCIRVECAAVYTHRDGYTVFVESCLIHIGPVPPVPPGPGPNPIPPNPTPVFPNEKLGLSSFTYNNFIAKVDPLYCPQLAAAFAVNFDGFSAQINAKTLTNSEDTLKKLNVANNQTIARMNIPKTTVDTFFTLLKTKLSEIDDKIGLENINNLNTCFCEISAGLKAIQPSATLGIKFKNQSRFAADSIYPLY